MNSCVRTLPLIEKLVPGMKQNFLADWTVERESDVVVALEPFVILSSAEQVAVQSGQLQRNPLTGFVRPGLLSRLFR